MRVKDVGFFNLVCSIIQMVCLLFVFINENQSLDWFVIGIQVATLFFQFFVKEE